ncbi:MAG: amidohydrolase, partial [Bacteroidota bacterium]
LPTWSAEDQLLAKATQIEMKSSKISGLATKLDTMGLPNSVGVVNVMGRQMMTMGGGSDDIADISWTVPTIVLNYPSNIPGLPGHHWSNAISMATPIAHKGIVSGAKAEAMTILDLLYKPELLTKAWDYYKTKQTKEIQYTPLVGEKDNPAVYLNQKIMIEFAPKLKPNYYDPNKYKTYLEQLGIQYPTVRPDQKEAVQKATTKK